MLETEHFLNLRRWLAWDNQVVPVRHDYEVDIAWWIACGESAKIWSHLWKIHLLKNLSQVILPWSQRISETKELTLETPNSWFGILNLLRYLRENEPFWLIYWSVEKNEATSETAKLSVWSWLIIKMILRVVAWGVWAYFASLSMTWVKPFATKRALSTPERGPMSQRDSMTLPWSSWERSPRGTGSYASWPELQREMSPFLRSSLISFFE